MQDGDPLSMILALLALIVLQILCFIGEAASEMLSESRLKRITEEETGDVTALTKFSSIDERKRTLSFRNGVFLCSISAAIIVYLTIHSLLSYYLSSLPAVLVLCTAAAVLFGALFGYAVSEAARRAFVQKGDETILSYSKVLLAICRLFLPFAVICHAISSLFVRILGADPEYEDADLTEDEFKLLIDEGSEDGAIDTAEQEMIHNILEFDDLSIAEIMTHRTEVEEVYLDSTFEEIIRLASESGHSRLPVCGDDLDDVKGVLMVKDLLFFTLDRSHEFHVKDVMRDVIFLPETALADEALEQLRKERIQLAIVVDEYGGTAGIVTMEDLLETIVGNIQDEYDDEPEAFTKISDNEYVFDGAALLDDIRDTLHLEFEDADDSYDTIAGYVIDHLHRIPSPNEKATVEDAEAVYTVLEMEEHRITKIGAILKPKSEGSKENID